MSDTEEKEGQDESNMSALENLDDFVSPDTTLVDFSTTYEPGQYFFTNLREELAVRWIFFDIL